MAHVLVRIKVKDQAEWKKGFEAASSLREKFGSKGAHAFASADDPNAIVIMGRYESHDKAREMFQSQEFRDVAQRAGVVGTPEVTYLTNIVKLDA